MTNHTFSKKKDGAYLFPEYIRDDGIYIILSTDRKVNGTWKRVYVVKDNDHHEVGIFKTLKEAKEKFSNI